MIEIRKLLNNVNICSIEGDIDNDKLCTPLLMESDSYEGGLLYIINKVNKPMTEVDCSSFSSMPYAIVVENGQIIKNGTSTVIRVESTRCAFAHACSNMYGIDYEKMKIIGITGSNGKTTTATLIYEILSRAGYNTGFIGTGKIIINGNIESSEEYSMTTPDPTLLYEALYKMQKAKCEYVVMEVSSHSIALEKVAAIKFEYGIFTNLSAEHLDFHKTIDNYFSTKMRLFQQTKSALFNLDDKYSALAYENAECTKSAIGIINSAPVYATEIKMSGLHGTEFFYREKDLICKVRTQLPGAFNIYNVIMAIRCTKELGIKPCISKGIIENISHISGRMQTYYDDITVIIDYAHTPFALYNCLNFLFSIKKQKQNIITVFGCGGDRDKSKRKPMGEISSLYSDFVIITSDNNRGEAFENIAADISEGISNVNHKIIKCRNFAIHHAIENAKSGDIVAVIGKGSELYINSGKEALRSSDSEIVKEALKKRKLNYENKS